MSPSTTSPFPVKDVAVPTTVQQFVLDLELPAPECFANFRAGANGEALAHLRRVAAGDCGEVTYLWGADGAGKSHLLRAAVAAAGEVGSAAAYVDLRDRDAGSLASADVPRLLALDHVDEASADAQGVAFTLFNRVRERSGAVVGAGACPPLQLAVREDLRTRLGWGPVFEIRPLDDGEKREALAEAAALRGVGLPDDAITLLLQQGPRDLRSLLACLTAIDRFALSLRRAITVPLVREWMRSRQARSGSSGS